MNQTIEKSLQSLIPILKTGKVESTYALRVTPLDKYDLPQLKMFLETFNDYIMCEETSKKNKKHYHAVIFTNLYEDDVRKKIREFLSIYFVDPPKRGDANKQYNLSETNDLEIAIIYILKDSGIVYTSDNINTKTLEELTKKSYKKYSKEDFASQLELLKASFKENDTRLDDMLIELVRLKALYRQPINMSYLYQLCLSYRIHNQPSRSEDYVREFLSRYN